MIVITDGDLRCVAPLIDGRVGAEPVVSRRRLLQRGQCELSDSSRVQCGHHREPLCISETRCARTTTSPPLVQQGPGICAAGNARDQASETCKSRGLIKRTCMVKAKNVNQVRQARQAQGKDQSAPRAYKEM